MSFNNREVISVNIGQAGSQIGDAIWRLYCQEHEISAEGKCEMQGDSFSSNLSSFFEERNGAKYVPRAIFVDTEPTVIDQIRSGTRRQTYHPDQLISGKEDAANNFVRGYHTIGNEMIDSVLDRIRKMTERANNLQGFFLCHSFGGGTGAGFSAKLVDHLMEDYTRATKFQIAVYPAPVISSTVVEPYNAVLTTHATLDQIDCSFMFDNQALYDIALGKLSIDRPSYTHLNRLISQVVSSLTTSLRFSGALNVDLDDFRTNLVPFPRIHFPIAAYAPLPSADRKSYDAIDTAELTRHAFEQKNSMMQCDMAGGKYMACCLLYRGDVVAKDINEAIRFVKNQRKIQFVNWCPTGFKIGINSKPPTFDRSADFLPPARGVALIASNTAIKSAFAALNKKFDLMFARRAFVHWYVNEGMEPTELEEARYNLAVLEKDYEEVENCT